MPTSENKGNGSPVCPRSDQPSGPSKIRIAVFGQHDVGKSALTVRYLTKRFIGEYKSNTDLLYHQTVTIGQTSIDVEIVDITTSVSGPSAPKRKTFPLEEIQRADGFVIVYSIAERSSFKFAQDALETIINHHNQKASLCPNFPSTTSKSASSSPNRSPLPRTTCPILLIANKNDLEHTRVVDKVEGLATSLQYGTQFYELSVAENSPEVYTSFKGLISTFISSQSKEPAKRKFSVSKMLGNLRIGKGIAANQVVAGHASIADIDILSESDPIEKSNENISSLTNEEITDYFIFEAIDLVCCNNVGNMKKMSKAKHDLIFSCVPRSQG